MGTLAQSALCFLAVGTKTFQVPGQLDDFSTICSVMVNVGYFTAQHMSRELEHTVMSVSKICAMNHSGTLSQN